MNLNQLIATILAIKAIHKTAIVEILPKSMVTNTNWAFYHDLDNFLTPTILGSSLHSHGIGVTFLGIYHSEVNSNLSIVIRP